MILKAVPGFLIKFQEGNPVMLVGGRSRKKHPESNRFSVQPVEEITGA